MSEDNEWPEKAEKGRGGGGNAGVSNGRGAVDQFIAHGMGVYCSDCIP